ncbi:hypothetical protein AN641_06290 [Candidatus Epulonipiscioides gigas]|nr:hypothetical protein AN641_06290 [Epulopiscium sp. SCG-C07WGA-EpuloA2]
MQKVLEISYLYDFYQNLLTPKQKELITGYYFEDFSLRELSDMYNISRQSVYNTINKVERKLVQFEVKLGLVKKFMALEEIVEKLDKLVSNTVPLKEQDLVYIKNLLAELKNEI